MQWLLAVLLGAQIVTEQTDVPRHAEWIGTIEFNDSRGMLVRPTTAVLDFSDDGAVAGRWLSKSATGSGGTLTGTIKNGRLKLRVLFFGGATHARPDGTEELMALERCKADAEFIGVLYASGAMRLSTKRVEFDSDAKRARNQDCEDITGVVWTLQPHIH